MNDREFRDTRKRIDRFIERWRHILWLTQWEITTTYHRSTPPDMEGANGWGAQMDIVPQWHYMKAMIRINMPYVIDLSDDDLEKAVMHELLHCIVSETRTKKSDLRHEERVVSHLTKALWAARLTGWNDAKDDSRKQAKA